MSRNVSRFRCRTVPPPPLRAPVRWPETEVAVATALGRDANLLILDEPAANLDPRGPVAPSSRTACRTPGRCRDVDLQSSSRRSCRTGQPGDRTRPGQGGPRRPVADSVDLSSRLSCTAFACYGPRVRSPGQSPPGDSATPVTACSGTAASRSRPAALSRHVVALRRTDRIAGTARGRCRVSGKERAHG